jgi:hypothetical protein
VIEKSGLRKQDNSETAQGYYAFSAAGDYYGAVNAGKDEVLQILLDAKKKCSASPPAKADFKETSMKTEARVPEGAAVLNVYSRIDPLPSGLKVEDLNRSIGRDHLWILKDELKDIALKLKDASEAPLPEPLARRLVRFHLIDNVRGEPDLWEPKNIKSREFKLTKLSASDERLRIRIEGVYSMLMPPRHRDERPHVVPEMGLTGTLQGILEIDPRDTTLKSAKLYSAAEGWGESVYTKTAPKGKFPVKFAMVLAEDALSHKIAPQGVMDRGREDYLAPK